MISFRAFSFHYPGAAHPTLRDVDLDVAEGELALVAGHTGTGKSTLLRAVNGLVPHFTGGHVEGHVAVRGVDTRRAPPREMAHLVGYVGQDPAAGFVTDTVEEELAYAMEQQALAAPTMRRRVEEVLDLLGIAELRRRPLGTLSGGQQQRVAIGAALTLSPPVLVLDEPTSALDPTAAEDALSSVLRLVHDLGLTVLVAEHRLERIAHYADTLLLVEADGQVRRGRPEVLLRTSPVAPPVVELGRLAGWDPLPLSVRDARRAAAPLRERLERSAVPPVRAGTRVVAGTPAVEARGLVVRYGDVVAVDGADLRFDRGEVVAVMGRNGSGKSTLLWALRGARRPGAGRLWVQGHDMLRIDKGAARRLVALVPQTASDLLYLDTVAAECAQGDAESGAAPGTCRALLDELTERAERPDDLVAPDRHPRDLSEGQRLALVLAIQLTAAPQVVLLDEPTRGLDYRAKEGLARVVDRLAASGHVVVVASHDVEFAARVAGRVVVMAEGQVVSDGPAAEVLVASPSLAPQIAKVLGPRPWLTVGQVAGALAGAHV